MNKGRRNFQAPQPHTTDGLVDFSGFGIRAKLSGDGLGIVLLALIVAILALIIALVK